MAELTDPPKVIIERSQGDAGDAVLRLGGELDQSNADQLLDAVRLVIELGPPRLVFDLEELSFMDSSGISALIFAANALPDVSVRNSSPIVRRILEATGLAETLQLS